MLKYASLYTNEKAYVDDAVECLISHAQEVGIVLLPDEVALHDAVAACVHHAPFEEEAAVPSIEVRREQFLDGVVGAVLRHGIENGIDLGRDVILWLRTRLEAKVLADGPEGSDTDWVAFDRATLLSGHRNRRTGELRVWDVGQSSFKR